MSRHTPGPWVLSQVNGKSESIFHVFPENRQFAPNDVATLFCVNSEERRANGRVIAAAPEMLSALEEVLEIAEQRGYQPEWLANARAAVAKARGRA